MAFSSVTEFNLFVLTLAWIAGFTPLWLESLRRARTGVGDATPRAWRWWHGVGLALVLFPFLRMGVSTYYDVLALVQATATGAYYELPPYPASRLWRTVSRQILYYILIPGTGLLLLWDGRPRLPQLKRAGLAPRTTVREDALHGFALFFGVLVAYVGAMFVAFVLLGDLLVATADESRLWGNVTPLLIVMLSAVPGIAEEFLFRGLLLAALATRLPWRWAAVTQAVFFGLIHAGYMTWAHVLGPFAFGLGMAFVARHLGLASAMVLHAGVNVTFFTFEVASVQPGAWWVLGSLAVLNVYAAYATRMRGVVLLWQGLFARRRVPADEDRMVVYETRRAP